jgi:hypothetical protein
VDVINNVELKLTHYIIYNVRTTNAIKLKLFAQNNRVIPEKVVRCGGVRGEVRLQAM